MGDFFTTSRKNKNVFGNETGANVAKGDDDEVTRMRTPIILSLSGVKGRLWLFPPPTVVLVFCAFMHCACLF